jgi:hypothetical protein
MMVSPERLLRGPHTDVSNGIDAETFLENFSA